MSAPSTTITSRDNPLIKYVRSLQRPSVRYAERAFVVEGLRTVLDGIAAGYVPRLVLLTPEFDRSKLGDHVGETLTRLVDPGLMKIMADTVTPQGILAVFPMPAIDSRTSQPECSLVIDALHDPGNLGTLLRTAAAAGLSRVLLTPGTVDPFNAKVVRSGMGAHFRIAIERLTLPVDRSGDQTVLLLQTEGTTDYSDVDLTGPIWIVVGSEAHGIQLEFSTMKTISVTLPMPGNAESLNAAVAGSIVIYEALRQRRNASRSAKLPHKH